MTRFELVTLFKLLMMLNYELSVANATVLGGETINPDTYEKSRRNAYDLAMFVSIMDNTK